MKKILSLFFLLAISNLHAQFIARDIIATAGEHSSVPALSITWTIGEPVAGTSSTPTLILTQGFEQPEVISLSGISSNEDPGNIFPFPNPAADQITIDFSSMKPGKYTVSGFDASGKLVVLTTAEVISFSYRQKIDLTNLCKGIYLFKITNEDGSVSKLFRISKT